MRFLRGKWTRLSPLLVRLLLTALCLGWARAEDLPPAPANQIYDPDFLITREATDQIAKVLAAFGTAQETTVYLAVFTQMPHLIEETAQDLNQAWDQSGYGVVIIFAPRRQEARVLPSPQLSLLVRPDALTATFQKAAEHGMKLGDYSLAAEEGTGAVLKQVRDLLAEAGAGPQTAPWRLTRPWLLGGLGLCAVLGLLVLWIAVRIWRRSNLFDNSYRFPVASTPAPRRFGANRCGGLMATLDPPPAPLKAKDV